MNEHDMEDFRMTCERIIDRVGEVFVGNRLLLRKLLAAALANGHILFEDYPGLGKTLLAKVFSRAIGTDTKRVQFTPDLLPSDILGVNVWRQNQGGLSDGQGTGLHERVASRRNQPGPAKNAGGPARGHGRTPSDHRRRNDGFGQPVRRNRDPEPHRAGGTYPLPEAQLDRFCSSWRPAIRPTGTWKTNILLRRIQWQKDDPTSDLEPAVDVKGFIELQRSVETEVYVDHVIVDYITQLVRLTREHQRVRWESAPGEGWRCSGYPEALP